MALKFRILYKLVKPSTSLIDDPLIQYNLKDFILELKFSSEEKNHRKCRLHFKDVFGFRYSSEPLCTVDEIEAYDKIVEIIKSNWLKEFDKTDEIFTHTKRRELHHYMIYFDDDGVYEFIAKSFEVEEV